MRRNLNINQLTRPIICIRVSAVVERRPNRLFTVLRGVDGKGYQIRDFDTGSLRGDFTSIAAVKEWLRVEQSI